MKLDMLCPQNCGTAHQRGVTGRRSQARLVERAAPSGQAITGGEIRALPKRPIIPLAGRSSGRHRLGASSLNRAETTHRNGSEYSEVQGRTERIRMIYLVHHAVAVGPADDAARPLSAAGRAAADILAREAAGRGVAPECVWHSGKLRARQTAEIFWRACNPLAEFSAVRGLQSADPPTWMHDKLFGEARDLMLVGHMPHIARLLDALLGYGPNATGGAFPLHGVVALAASDDRWVEQWRLG